MQIDRGNGGKLSSGAPRMDSQILFYSYSTPLSVLHMFAATIP